jgi:hypothetical protein
LTLLLSGAGAGAGACAGVGAGVGVGVGVGVGFCFGFGVGAGVIFGAVVVPGWRSFFFCEIMKNQDLIPSYNSYEICHQ